MNVLKPEKKLTVIAALTEGCSIRSVSRMMGIHKKTIMKLLVEVGQECEQMKLRDLRCEAVECDELWTFVSKNKGVLKPDDRKAYPGYGGQYTLYLQRSGPKGKYAPPNVSGTEIAEILGVLDYSKVWSIHPTWSGKT